MSGQGHPEFIAWAEGLRDLHREKSGGYGTDADPFANFTHVAAVSGRERWEYAVDRSIEKLVRVKSLTTQGRFSDLAEEFRDIGGLMGCSHAMLTEDHPVDAPVHLAETKSPPDAQRERRILENPSGFAPGCEFPKCDCLSRCVVDG